MSLTPVQDSVSAAAAVFSKILEVLSGGFSLVSTGFTDGATLPKGSLLKVDEAARTATPIKTAITVADSVSSQVHFVAAGHHFAVGDVIGVTVGGKARKITAIKAKTGTTATGGAGDRITVATSDTAGAGSGIATSATGVVFYHAATTTATGTLKVTPNTLLRDDALIGTTLVEAVTAVRRATAYKNRIQAHNSTHLAGLYSTIQISESY
jgi:hypothetical protein